MNDAQSALNDCAVACGRQADEVEYARRWWQLIRAELVADCEDGCVTARTRAQTARRGAPRGKKVPQRQLCDWVVTARSCCADGTAWLATVDEAHGVAGEHKSVPNYELLMGIDTQEGAHVFVVVPRTKEDANLAKGVRLVALRLAATETQSLRPVSAPGLFREGEVLYSVSVGSALSAIYRSRAVAMVHTIAPKLRHAIVRGSTTRVFEDSKVDWESPPRPAAASGSRLNAAQNTALSNVEAPISVVVGPPGTGKSSFIAALVSRRLPRDQRCLCCCTTNKAIDSLVDKLQASEGLAGHVLTVGRAEAMGDAARSCTVEALVAMDQPVLTALRALVRATNARERKEQFLAVVDRPGPKRDKDGKEQNRGFVERSLEKLNELTPGELTEPLKRSPTTARLIAMVDAQTAAVTSQDLVDMSIVYLAKPSADAGKLEKRQAAKAALKEARAVEQRCTELHEFAVSGATARLWRRARVVCCTAAAAATLPLRLERAFETDGDEKAAVERADVTFEFVVLDEAGAMLEPDAMAACGHGAQAVVLVGDQRQLSPFSKWRDAKRRGYVTSLLERLAAAPRSTAPSTTTLREQYRMHPQICNIVSSTFYDNSLMTPSSVISQRPLRQAVAFIDYGSQRQFHENRNGSSFTNDYEAGICAQVVSALQQHGGHHPRCIAVLCFYNGQKTVVARKVSKHVLVASVDAVQGREADVVVLLTTRSNEFGDLGFTCDASRVNVALSRARHLLIVLGDRQLLESDQRVWQPALQAAQKSGMKTYRGSADFVEDYQRDTPPKYAGKWPPPKIEPLWNANEPSLDEMLNGNDEDEPAPETAEEELRQANNPDVGQWDGITAQTLALDINASTANDDNWDTLGIERGGEVPDEWDA
ncbi:P-loop containing nucleoside triphosphate hydrolase protein [Pelagophyceae sp. CCMP2097]|nr:P-loop containing nucleoside triphosphate hydrolase protein [Pelagophyceae sp. CCMP2097]